MQKNWHQLNFKANNLIRSRVFNVIVIVRVYANGSTSGKNRKFSGWKYARYKLIKIYNDSRKSEII